MQGLLCADDTAAFETMLAAVPQLVEQLEVAISKMAKVGGGGKGGLARERSPINFGALAARDALLVEVALWGDDVDAVRRHPQAAEIVSGLGRVVKDAYRVIDRRADRQYLGRCLNTSGDEECQAELWAKPHAKEVECRLCGYVHIVAERRLDMLEMAKGVICTVKEASSYVGEVGGIVVSQSSIKGYLFRKRLLYVPGTTMIRLGELLDLLAEDSAKQSA
jgi:hypothetical protein